MKLLNLFKKKAEDKNYVLDVVTKYDDGYGSHWYNWTSDPFFTLNEAKKIKSKIEHLYYHVEIIKVK